VSEVLHMRLPRDHSAPRRARRALRRVGDLAPVHDEAVLLASELTTRAVLNAGVDPHEKIELAVELSGRRVRISVCDPGLRGFVHPRRGFGLVEAIAGRFELSGPRVWAELAL
jgi:anti-sigma regulatory factor (Ser/Thr protein kinase)